MKLSIAILFFCLLFSTVSADQEEQGIPGILHKIQQFFLFICTRCQQIVKLIDEAIDNETLRKDATELCDAILGYNQAIARTCKKIVEDILNEVYTQLKRMEPDQTTCIKLHLCESCDTNSSLSLIRKHGDAGTADMAKLVGGIAKLQFLVMAENSTEFLLSLN